MFDNLSARLQAVAAAVRGKGRLTEANIGHAVRDVRKAMIEADVALPVVREFVDKVRDRAVGLEVTRSLSPGQAFIKILNDELTATLGPGAASLDLRHQPPVVILLAGLQGAGKTTTAAKLALHLQESEGQQVMLAGLDTRRPAAIEQLEQLATRTGAGFVAPESGEPAPDTAERAVAEARRRQSGVLILDTAGRSGLDAGRRGVLGRLPVRRVRWPGQLQPGDDRRRTLRGSRLADRVCVSVVQPHSAVERSG